MGIALSILHPSVSRSHFRPPYNFHGMAWIFLNMCILCYNFSKVKRDLPTFTVTLNPHLEKIIIAYKISTFMTGLLYFMGAFLVITPLGSEASDVVTLK